MHKTSTWFEHFIYQCDNLINNINLLKTIVFQIKEILYNLRNKGCG